MSEHQDEDPAVRVRLKTPEERAAAEADREAARTETCFRAGDPWHCRGDLWANGDPFGIASRSCLIGLATEYANELHCAPDEDIQATLAEFSWTRAVARISEIHHAYPEADSLVVFQSTFWNRLKVVRRKRYNRFNCGPQCRANHKCCHHCCGDCR